MLEQNFTHALEDRLAQRTAPVGIIGLGYVGLPLWAAAARTGFAMTGFGVDAAKTDAINNGRSYIDAVKSEEVPRTWLPNACGRRQRSTNAATAT